MAIQPKTLNLGYSFSQSFPGKLPHAGHTYRFWRYKNKQDNTVFTFRELTVFVGDRYLQFGLAKENLVTWEFKEEALSLAHQRNAAWNK